MNLRKLLNPLVRLSRRALSPRGLTGRATAPFALALAAMLCVALPLSWGTRRAAVLQEYGREAGALASSIALGVPGEAHEGWVGAFPEGEAIADWTSAPEELRQLREGMARTARALGLSAPVATLRIRERTRDTLMANPKSHKQGALQRMVTTASRPSWLGGVDYLPAMENTLLQGEAASSGVVAGSDGRAVFGWAPILDRFGETLAVVQVEVPVDARLAALLHAHLLSAAGLLGVFGFALFVSVRRVRRTTGALQELAETAAAAELEDPFLADDPSEEVLGLTVALEQRRASMQALRSELTTQVAQVRQEQARAVQRANGYGRLTAELTRGYPAALRSLAGAVGRVPSATMSSEEQAVLRDAVLSTCRLAGALDQQGELLRVASGVRALEPTAISIRAIVDDALEAARRRAQERGVDLRVVLGSSLPESVETDPQVLRRCIAAFTDASVQAVADNGGGTVSLRVKRLQGTSTSDVRFELIDSGPAMSEAQRASLFAPFPTPEGTHPRRVHALDASLSVARGLLKLLGAEVEVESMAGSGNRIAFTLTFQTDEPPPTPPGPYPSAVPSEAHRFGLERPEGAGLALDNAGGG